MRRYWPVGAIPHTGLQEFEGKALLRWTLADLKSVGKNLEKKVEDVERQALGKAT